MHYKYHCVPIIKCQHLLQLISKNSEQQTPPSRSNTSSTLKQHIPSNNMHAFSKLMPLALSALAIAAPSQLQERAGTAYTDTVELYPLIYRYTLS